MHRLANRRPLRSPGDWALRLVAVVACSAGLAVSATTDAAADSPLDQARAAARQLAASVQHLQDQAEVAAESYDRASTGLSAAVEKRIAAENSLSSAQTTTARVHSLAAQQARALYVSGGPLALYAGLITSSDVSSLADRISSVRRLVAVDQSLGAAATAAQDRAARLADQLGTAQQAQLTAEDAAATAAGQVRSLLAQQQTLLDAANQQVKQLLAQQLEAEKAAAAAAFQARLAAAYQTAGLALPVTASPPAGPLQQQAVNAMQELVAVHPPYVWGGTGPGGYDCSGLVGAAYAAAGLVLPRTAAQQWLAGTHPALTDLKPGDLLFWATDTSNPATIHHVAMYAGGNLMWSTDHTGDVARLQPIWGEGFIGATRPEAAAAAAVPGPFWRAGP